VDFTNRIQYNIKGFVFANEVIFMKKIKIKFIENNFRLLVIALSHFVNDIHSAFLPTFIPIIVEQLGIGYGQAGLLKSLSGIIHMLIQPMAGYMSDSFSRPYAIVAGPFMTAFGASMLPLSHSYGMAFLFVGLWSMGSAIYHPLGNGGVGHIVPPWKLASSLAIFSVGGVLGATISPLYAITLYKIFGPTFLLPLGAMIPVAVVSYLIWKTFPTLSSNNSKDKPSPLNFLQTTMRVFKTIFPIWTVSVSRDTATQGIKFFLPLLIASKGGNIVDIGTILFIISIIGAISPILGGRLADKLGDKKVIIVVMTLAPVFLLPAALTEGLTSIALYVVGIALLQAILPVTGAAAQKKAPESRSVVASLVGGLAYGLGGILVAPLGIFADIWGLEATLSFIALLPWLPMSLFFLRRKSL